jgi:hypothetical protein
MGTPGHPLTAVAGFTFRFRGKKLATACQRDVRSLTYGRGWTNVE